MENKDSDNLNRSGVLMLAMVIVFWGTSWPILKIGLNEIPPFTYRDLIAPTAAVLLFGLGLVMKEKMIRPTGQWGALILASALNVTGWHVFSAFGIKLMGSGHASIIAFTMPLWAVLLSMIFIGERPTFRRIAGLVVGLAGLGVLLIGKFGVLQAGAPGRRLHASVGAMLGGGNGGAKTHRLEIAAFHPGGLAVSDRRTAHRHRCPDCRGARFGTCLGRRPMVDRLYQGSLTNTHRDGFPRFSARSVRRRDAGHRKACATPSYPLAESRGKPPFRSRMRRVGGRRKVWPMRCIACTFPPTRQAAYAISMGVSQ